MSVEFHGLAEIQQRLKQMMSEKEFKKLTDKAVTAGATVLKKEVTRRLSSNLGDYSIGATVEETVMSKPKLKRGARTVQIGWNGPLERYRIIHLNENGYKRDGKFYGPQLGGYKQIAKAMETKKQEVFDVMRREMAKRL
ncbi:MAG TPA: hypothetical protein H9983_06355 [Candidatus Kurthia intestinigallinarum]|nr:hypothetical protein [Candidatus Kurthia intestinigallinarum]